MGPCVLFTYRLGYCHSQTCHDIIEWCFTPLSTVFQSYHGNSSHYLCTSWVSPVLGWGSEGSCPRILPRNNPKDPVRLEPRTPGFRVENFTTKPRNMPP